MPKKMTQQEFIQKSKDIFGANTFDYSQCNYINSSTNIILICTVDLHGSFEINPGNHINKNLGCKICKDIVYDTHSFKIIASRKHNNYYDYDRVIYTGPKNKVIITCYEHGDFEQRSENHTSGLNGCPNCGPNNIKLTIEQFIERAKLIHNINGIPTYDYSESIYINWNTKVNVKCLLHGIFSVLPENHLRQQSGCPLCHNKTEGILFSVIKTLHPDIKQGYRVDWCKNVHNNYLPFDFVIPSLNIIIELDGPQHFKQISNWCSFQETQNTDKYKMQCANINGYSVIRLLQEDVLYNKIDWLKLILEAIQLLTSYKPINKNICICINDEYTPYLLNANILIEQLKINN